MKKGLIYIVLTILLIVGGFLTGHKFMDISISELNLNDISISSTTMSWQFKQNLIFTMAIGLIPFLHFISIKISKVNSLSHKLSILVIIVMTGIVLWQFRILQLNKMFEKFTDFNINKGIKNAYYAEDLRFGLYLTIGFLIGAVISALTFKQINKGNPIADSRLYLVPINNSRL